MAVPDKLVEDRGRELAVKLKFKKLADFGPEAIANQVPELKQAARAPRGARRRSRARSATCRRSARRSRSSSATPRSASKLMKELGLGDEGGGGLSHGRTEDPGSAEAARHARPEGSLLDEILAETKMKPERRRLRRRQGASRRSSPSCSRRSTQGEKVDKAIVDAMIAEIDKKLSQQVDADPPPPRRSRSSSRRGAASSSSSTARTSARTSRSSCSTAPRTTSSPTSRTRPRSRRAASTRSSTPPSTARSAASPTARSSRTTSSARARRTSRCSRSARRSRRWRTRRSSRPPAPQFFGQKDYPEPARTSRTSSRSSRARSTRSGTPSARREDARYVGLVHAALPAAAAVRREHGPGEVLQLRGGRRRQPRRVPLGQRLLRASPRRIADSFAKYRWCPNIIGPQSGGTVENLPLHQYEAMGEIQTKIPTEVHAHRAPRVRALRGGLHRPHVPQGLGQRGVLLGQLACRSQDLRQQPGGQGRRD